MATAFAIGLVVGLSLLFLACVELGRRQGLQRMSRLGREGLEGFGTVEGALFTLLGLLIAFTFAAAQGRFDRRRDLVVEEANALGTAYLRIDLLPAAAQPALRRAFADYLDARMHMYRDLRPLGSVDEDWARVEGMEREIWRQAVAACRASDVPQVMQVVIPAINSAFDVATTRLAALRNHVPLLIIVLLVALAVASSVIAGYGLGHSGRSWIHSLSLAILLSSTIYVIIDYEFPRVGLIRMTSTDELLRDLRAQMP